MSTPTEAFDQFYEDHYGTALALAYALCGSTGMAEDIVQESFVALLPRWNKVDSPLAWLRRVITNKSVSTFRRRRSEAKVVLRLEARERVRPTASDISGEDSELWNRARTLPKRQAQVVALRYINELTTTEIASVLGLSENTVKTHIRRAKQSLAKWIQEDPRSDLSATSTEEPSRRPTVERRAGK